MNNDLINHIAQILEYLENPKIDTYLHNPNVSSIILLGLAHNLHALSNYYMYNDNDGEKAREILSYTKKLLEHYVNNYSSVALNFDKMSKEEIYTELSILQDLPEIYARVMYSLGRTYRYQGNEQDAVPHLKLSQYLGQKTGIFESYLSTLNIIDLTIGAEVDRAIKNGNHVLAQKKLIEIIDLYQALGQDETRYKLDYQPNTTKQDLIIPKADAYNLITLGERITKHYATLIVITNDPVKNTAYLKEITRQFLGDSNTPGILEISKHTSLRKASSSYNTLGNIIVKLYDASINSKSLQKALIEQLNLSRGDALDIAWQIFDLSHYLSRNTDITKADAYHGMIKVYKRKINNKTHNSEQQNIMNAKIAELTEKRDKINAVLKRMRN